MNHKYLLIYIKKFWIALFAMLASFALAQGPTLEMGAATVTAGAVSTHTSTLQKNTDNPTGNAFTAYSTSSPLTVTMAITQQTYPLANAYNGFLGSLFLGDTANANNGNVAVSPYVLMTNVGNVGTAAPYTTDNSQYTSFASTAGTGIDIAANYAVRATTSVNALGLQATDGRYKMGEITLTFSRGVNNPLIHLKGLGGGQQNAAQTAFIFSFTTEFTVKSVLNSSGTEMLSSTAISGLSGTNLNVNNTNKTINNDYTGLTAPTTTNSGRGTVRFQNNDVRTIVLEVYMNGNQTSQSWTGNGGISADGWLLGVSLGESDLQVTNTVNTPISAPGATRVFTVTATNNGASNNTGVSVTDLLPSGYNFVSASASVGSYNQTNGVWTIGNLNDQASATLTITATVNPSGNYSSTATISTTSGISDPNTVNNSALVSIDIDSDGDNIPDNIDLDDDNDGILDCVENGLSTASFLNNNTFVQIQNASGTSSSVVQLTPDATSQRGASWSVGKIDFTKSFSFGFDANLGTKDATGADGIAVVFHNSPAGTSAIGTVGIGMGAAGIANGLVLEIDTFDNGLAVGDVTADHGQIWDSDNQGTGLTTAVAFPNLEDGLWHPVVVTWNASTQTLSYTIDGINAGTLTTANFANTYFGANKVFFGFTSSTGSFSNLQQIRINNFCNVPLELDTDGDGFSNSLDLDSDNDGCPDVIEGAANFQSGASYIVNDRLNTGVNGSGVPNVPAGTNYVQSTGQAIGTSQNIAANECYIDAKNDINETPRNTPVSGSLLTNDIATGLAMSSTVLPTYLNASGVATAFVYGTAANVYSASGVLAGSMTVNSNGTYTFTPTTTFIGSVPVTYTAVNGVSSTDTASLEIKVVPTVNTYFNNPPVALNDTGITKLNTNLSSTVLGNDSDPDGNTITVSAVNGVAANVGNSVTVAGVNAAGTAVANAGTLTINAAGIYTFVPFNNFVGTVNPVPYTITDGNGGTSTANLSIEVQAATTPPAVFANDDAKATPKGVPASGNILSNDTRTSAGTLSVTGATVNGAALTVNGTAQTIAGVGTLSISPTTGAYTFSPLATYVGTTPVVYTISDGLGNISTATLYLTSLDSGFIDAKNDINQTPINVPVSGSILANDTSSTTATVASASQGATAIALGTTPVQVSGVNTAGTTVANAGTITLNSAGAYTFSPATGFVGTVSIDYIAINTIGNTDPASLQIKVVPAVNSTTNNPPVALNDTGVTKTGITLNSNVLGNDSDPDAANVLTVTGATQGATVIANNNVAVTVTGVNAAGATVTAGTFALNSNGAYTYIPAAAFVGTVNPITYTISDGAGGTSTATVNIEVKPATAPPVVFANDDAKVTLKGVAVSGTVATNDTNSAGGGVVITQATINGVNYNLTTAPVVGLLVPGVGTVSINSVGAYTFTPLPTYVGTYAIPYVASNTAGTASSPAVLYLTSLDGQAYCYRTPATPTSGTLQPVKHGITALNRAGSGTAEWPTARQGAWTVLEAKTKGFVVNRMAFNASGNPIGIPDSNFIEGMMVYDTTNNCLKVYTSNNGGTTFAWHCMTTQTCPN